MVVYKKYGETLRKLRKQRRFKLTDFEHLGVSPAALSKFENGNSLLKFDKLILILEELSVTLSEYEKCLNNYDLDKYELLIQKMIIATVDDNLSEYPLLYEEAIELKEQYLALAIKGKYTKLKTYEKEYILNYLEQVTFWGYIDLYTFYLCLDWLKLSQISFIFEDIFVMHPEVLNSLKHRNRVTHIIVHISMMYISKGDKKEAKRILNYVLKKEYTHTMFTKNMVNFVVGFWEVEFGNREKGVLAMEEALKTWKNLSYPGISNYYYRLYERYSLSQTPLKH